MSTLGWQPSDSSLFTMQQICNLITPGVHKQGALPGDTESPGLNLHLQKPADTEKTLHQTWIPPHSHEHKCRRLAAVQLGRQAWSCSCLLPPLQ